MSELTFNRCGTPLQVRPVCMYCGRPASHRDESRVKNPRQDPATGGGWGGGPGNGDGIIGVIVLVFVALVTLGQVVTWGRRKLAASAEPPLDPPDTLVVITTCERHQRYSWWYARVMAVTVLGIFAALVVLLVRVPSERLLHGEVLMVALCGLVAVIGALAVFVRTPVRVTTVRRDSVIVSNIRPAYFSVGPTAHR